MKEKFEPYYVPDQSYWPIIGALSLGMIAFGAGLFVQQMEQDSGRGGLVLLFGVLMLLGMIYGWFRHVIKESMAGLYSKQMDRSFRQGMSWFIFSEVMFFGVFFGALFYLRVLSVPWLAGAGNNAMTHEVLWPAFESIWPLITTPGGDSTQVMSWQGIPLYNTILLLISSVTLHYAHVGLKNEQRGKALGFLFVTVGLGFAFLCLQVQEYIHAYHELNLRLDSGVYGNTFYLLTGFHGMHVTLGAIILSVLWVRLYKGHFTATKHFAFEAGSWYWHFVDVVWLCLFFFVYVI
jgi:cytochrome c oxidase subunit 3